MESTVVAEAVNQLNITYKVKIWQERIDFFTGHMMANKTLGTIGEISLKGDLDLGAAGSSTVF